METVPDDPKETKESKDVVEAKQITVAFSPTMEPLFAWYCEVYKLPRTSALIQLATKALLSENLPPREDSDRDPGSPSS